jgi:hypothetical protein
MRYGYMECPIRTMGICNKGGPHQIICGVRTTTRHPFRQRDPAAAPAAMALPSLRRTARVNLRVNHVNLVNLAFLQLRLPRSRGANYPRTIGTLEGPMTGAFAAGVDRHARGRLRSMYTKPMTPQSLSCWSTSLPPLTMLRIGDAAPKVPSLRASCRCCFARVHFDEIGPSQP